MNVLLNMNTSKEIQYVYFWSDATLLTLTWQVSLWIIVSDLCMWLAF